MRTSIQALSLFLIIIASAFSQSKTNDTELYFLTLDGQTLKKRSQIASYIPINQVIDGKVYSVVNYHDFQRVQKELPELIEYSSKFTPPKVVHSKSDDDFPAGDEKYHTYDEVISMLKGFATNYSNIVEYKVLGKSIEGRDIPLIRLTNKKNRKNKFFTPGIVFLGTHHAREHLSTEVPLLILEHLVSSYASNSHIKNLIDSRDIYFIPLVNPDGALYDIKGKRYKMWRKNRVRNNNGSYGVDLNRNYSRFWGGSGASSSPRSDIYHGPRAFSEPETIAIKKFLEETANLRFVLSFHTYSELILYPWGGSYSGVGGKDQDVFEKMARKMSQWNNYKPMQASGLYIASGDTCDYAYGELNIFCFTFELSPKDFFSGGFYPGAGIIDKTFKANLNPALYMIESAADPYQVLD